MLVPTTGLEAIPLAGGPRGLLAEAATVERAVLGYPRGEAELCWILEQREGYLYRRGDQAVALAFVGHEGAGLVAALEATDLAIVLAHVETRAHALGVTSLSLQVPGSNAASVRHLIAPSDQRSDRMLAWPRDD
jgi:hypothetical protein